MLLEKYRKEKRLTRRKIEILKLLIKGYVNKQIADLLHISKNTVRTHRQEIKQWLGAKTSIEACYIAMKEGWI